MSEWWAVTMLISSALFAAGVVPIAWERAPAWRTAELSDFRVDFAHTLQRMDRLQPALLVVCLVSTIGFAVSAGGTARALAILAGAGYVMVLLAR
ncbi:MAG TPA: hypothetical protein VFI46_18775 [Jiangellaceae bacterium]|nr:hypothetical protein [Jiangellaceae bacterium]